MKNPEYILVVSNASPYVMQSIAELREQPAYQHLRTLVLTPNPKQDITRFAEKMPVEVIPCDFSADEIETALRPFKDQLRAVVCRGEKHIQYLRKVIPHLPPGLRVANPEALEAATNKRLMREAFLEKSPEITPHFVQVHDAGDETIQKVEDVLEYPVIVKPANLASSMLITACHNRSELVAALGSVFTLIQDVYKQQDRHGAPQVIVEEYLEGDFYSIDAYVAEPGTFYFCPVVGYVPAQQIGVDDFFLYKRFIPPKLDEAEIAAGNETVAKALTAIGLTHSSAHVELVLTKRGWKIIELGPRLGRFRHLMYKQAYDIDHSMNDLRLHLGLEPQIPTKLVQYCTAYSIYPYQEGTLKEITGIADVEKYPATKFLRIFAGPGDKCIHAKNGGGALAEFVIADSDPEAFKKVVAFVEEHLKAVVA